jgi:hypothetical protein
MNLCFKKCLPAWSLAFFLFAGLAPASAQAPTDNPAYPPLAEYESVIIFTEHDPVELVEHQALGRLTVRGSRQEPVFDLENAVEKAEEAARQLGANAVQITAFEPGNPRRGVWPRLTFDALRLPDVTPFEERIVWHPGRRLKRADFKGSVINRPNEAETSGSIAYTALPSSYAGTATVTVRALFNCRESYFVGKTIDPAFTLLHEQGHFDLAELYARRFVQRIRAEVEDYRDFERLHNRLFNEITRELEARHAAYDRDIYADHGKQPAWTTQIAAELRELEGHAQKTVVLPIQVKRVRTVMEK